MWMRASRLARAAYLTVRCSNSVWETGGFCVGLITRIDASEFIASNTALRYIAIFEETAATTVV